MILVKNDIKKEIKTVKVIERLKREGWVEADKKADAKADKKADV